MEHPPSNTHLPERQGSGGSFRHQGPFQHPSCRHPLSPCYRTDPPPLPHHPHRPRPPAPSSRPPQTTAAPDNQSTRHTASRGGGGQSIPPMQSVYKQNSGGLHRTSVGSTHGSSHGGSHGCGQHRGSGNGHCHHTAATPTPAAPPPASSLRLSKFVQMIHRKIPKREKNLGPKIRRYT